MTVSVDKEKNELIIKYFSGEKTDRKVKLVEGVDVKVDKKLAPYLHFWKGKDPDDPKHYYDAICEVLGRSTKQKFGKDIQAWKKWWKKQNNKKNREK